MATVNFQKETKWSNRHENYKEKIQGHFDIWNDTNITSLTERYNDTTKTLQGLVESAKAAKVTLRAYGSKWSLSKAPHTNGWLINTKPLNLYFRPGNSVLATSFQRDKSNLYFAQCGLSIQELNDLLRADKKALKTTGASNGQTIAGALSTGTHGAAFNFGAVQDFVVGLHIIAGNGHNYYLERESDKITNNQFTNTLDAVLIQNDDLFNAALISFGSFGIIHGVMIEAENLYHIEMNQGPYPLAEVEKAMLEMDFTTFNPFPQKGIPYHFQVIINPYERDIVYVKAMSKTKFILERGNVRKKKEEDTEQNDYEFGQDMPHFFGVISDIIPGLIPKLVSSLTRDNYQAYKGRIGTIGEIFSNTNTFGKVFSAEVGVALEDLKRALDIYYEVLDEVGNIAAIISLRYVKGSKALFACTRFEKTCIIEIDGVQSRRTRRFMDKFWARLRAKKILYAQHWGKFNDLHRSTQYCYGIHLLKWLESRSRLLDKDNAKVFESRFINSCGLNIRINNVSLDDIIT